MRTKSTARPNNMCVGLSDVLDDAHLTLPDEHSVVPVHSILDGDKSNLQRLHAVGFSHIRRDLLHNVLVSDVVVPSQFRKQNEFPKVSKDDKFEIPIASPDDSTPVVSATGCVTPVGSLLLEPTVAQSPITPEFNSAVLDFTAGVVRQTQHRASSVGLQSQPSTNIKPSKGIVIREPEYPVHCGWQGSHTTAAPVFKGKRKANIDSASSTDVRPTCKRTFVDIDSLSFHGAGKIKGTGDVTTTRTHRMQIELQNLNGHSLPLTLWNDLATDFPMQTYKELQQPVVLAVSSCYAKRYAVTGALQLSSTPATHVYLNPNVPETEHILAVYNEMLGTTPLLEYHMQQQNTSDSNITNNKVDLKTLLTINPETHKGVRFTVEATLTRIDTTATWYFNKCNVCSRGLDNKNPHWQCHQYGTQPIPDYRYCFKVIVEDSTGTITASCFSPETDKWVIGCVDLLNEVEDTNPRIIPHKLRVIENTQRLFTIHFGSKSKKDFPKFIIDNAPPIHPLTLPAPPICTSSPKPSTATSPGNEHTCPSEISQHLTTPSPITPEVPDKPHVIINKNQTTVKRELFATSTSEGTAENTKKSKTE